MKYKLDRSQEREDGTKYKGKLEYEKIRENKANVDNFTNFLPNL